MLDVSAKFGLLQAEGFVTVAEAANVHGVSAATVRRWATSGVGGFNGQTVYLEVVRYPGKMVTSLPAVLRFLDATSSHGGDSPVRSPEARRTAADRAGQFLDTIGI